MSENFDNGDRARLTDAAEWDPPQTSAFDNTTSAVYCDIIGVFRFRLCPE